MLYIIMGEDGKDSLSKRAANRAAHLQRLHELRDQGRLVLAGPMPAVDAVDPGPAGFTGSVIVAEFPSLADAQSWADAEPYLSGGVYTHVTVKPFKKVLP
ncbi:MAG: YciI family protein [Gammaproteobacteria bacterium]|jgi:uncharacterized protein YciI